MDMITLAMAKKGIADLKASGGVGYTESGPVVTFDGDTSGCNITMHYNATYVRLLERHIDPDTIARIVVSVSGSMVEVGKADMRVAWNAEHTSYDVFIIWQGMNVSLVFGYNDERGTNSDLCVLADPNFDAYVARIEYAEVHTIDPKYLPETVKTINLADYTVRGNFIVEQTLENLIVDGIVSGGCNNELNMNFTQDFFRDINTEKPIVISFNFGGLPVKVSGCTVVRNYDSPLATLLCFNVVTVLEDVGLINGYVIISRDWATVYVSPVEIPI